jgi:hypothetical protein
MREKDIKYISEFLKEFQNETDRGAALVGTALIDERLKLLLESHLMDCKATEIMLSGINAPLGTFSSRINMCYCLGLITELEYEECKTIKKIRNEFGHRVHGITFDDQKIKDLCNNLRANTPDGKRYDGNPRQLFINSVILTSLAFFYRPEYNVKNKCKTIKWEYELSP